MKDDYTLLVGTVQASIWRSDDGGDSWTRAKGERPKLPWSELQCFDLAVHPKDPKVVYAGTNDGVYRSDDRGASFERLDSALNDYDVWSLAIDPVNPDNIYAGCRPGAIFRTRDGGAHWEHTAAEFAEYCANVSVPRVLTMAVDPSDPRKIWAGAEVDGVRRSIDGGETWTRVESLEEPDIHFIAVSPGSNGNPSKVITSTAPEVYLSTDVGESWSTVGARENFPMTFCRGLAVKPDDPNTVFIGNGNSFIGDDGTILRSRDRGETWENLNVPKPNSPMWVFAVNAADPDLIISNSHYGEIFVSEDTGDNWNKLDREFSEIRSLAWTPN